MTDRELAGCALSDVLALLEKATPGEWRALEGPMPANHWSPAFCGGGEEDDVRVVSEVMDYCTAAMDDAEAIAAAVNFLRQYGPELLSRAPSRDAERLDYIERTFSGMTNRERYLPVQMIWGTGANGRTLREACDKYMARDAAIAAAEGKPSDQS